MAARLKVFVTSDGLTDYVVAASSRPKALAAWGVRQDLFKEGRAQETEDAALVKAALAQPGQVLRRPTGAKAPPTKARPLAEPKPAGPSKADLKKIADVERRLAALDAAHARARAALDAQRVALDRKAKGLESAHAADRQRLEAALKAARQARA